MLAPPTCLRENCRGRWSRLQLDEVARGWRSVLCDTETVQTGDKSSKESSFLCFPKDEALKAIDIWIVLNLRSEVHCPSAIFFFLLSLFPAIVSPGKFL